MHLRRDLGRKEVPTSDGPLERGEVTNRCSQNQVTPFGPMATARTAPTMAREARVPGPLAAGCLGKLARWAASTPTAPSSRSGAVASSGNRDAAWRPSLDRDAPSAGSRSPVDGGILLSPVTWPSKPVPPTPDFG